MRSHTDQAFAEVYEEFGRAEKLFPPFHSAHEGYGVILEELGEVWDEIKVNNKEKAREEMIQVAAMAIRFIVDLG